MASFICIAEKEDSEDIMELPVEQDGTILLTTVQAQFPNAIGLKYKSSSGGWRGVRVAGEALDPPVDGWGETTYIVTESNAMKRKSESNGHPGKAKKSLNLLEDIIVLGIPYDTTEEEFKKYFTESCGELAFGEIKFDRDTKKSRGFGFLRFVNEDGAKEALDRDHMLDGRKLEIRMSKQKEMDKTPKKLFVGRLPKDITKEELTSYFSDFGDVTDVFLPSPSRGFGFVTFSSGEESLQVLQNSHNLKGQRLNVTAAEPKESKMPPMQQNYGESYYGYSGGSTNNYNSYNSGNPTKLFVGRLPKGTSESEIKRYFATFGHIVDVFVPSPPRGFGFVTFSSSVEASRVLNMYHTFQGSQLNVTLAEPKEDKNASKEGLSGNANLEKNYSWEPSNHPENSWRPAAKSSDPYRDAGVYNQPPPGQNVASELKDMLMTLINSRK